MVKKHLRAHSTLCRASSSIRHFCLSSRPRRCLKASAEVTRKCPARFFPDNPLERKPGPHSLLSAQLILDPDLPAATPEPTENRPLTRTASALQPTGQPRVLGNEVLAVREQSAREPAFADSPIFGPSQPTRRDRGAGSPAAYHLMQQVLPSTADHRLRIRALARCAFAEPLLKVLAAGSKPTPRLFLQLHDRIIRGIVESL